MSHPLPFAYSVFLLKVAEHEHGAVQIAQEDFDSAWVGIKVADKGQMLHFSTYGKTIEDAAEIIYHKMVDSGYLDASEPMLTEIITKPEIVHRNTVDGQQDGICRKCGRPLYINALDPKYYQIKSAIGVNDSYDVCPKCEEILLGILKGLEDNPPHDGTDIREIADFAVDVFFTPGFEYDPIEFA